MVDGQLRSCNVTKHHATSRANYFRGRYTTSSVTDSHISNMVTVMQSENVLLTPLVKRRSRNITVKADDYRYNKTTSSKLRSE